MRMASVDNQSSAVLISISRMTGSCDLACFLMLCCAAVFVAAGRAYQISRHCLQHFSNYFHFSSFMLILKGLLQKIFSALPATSKENGEQTIIFRMIGRESSERIKGKAYQGKHLRNLFISCKEYHQHMRESSCDHRQRFGTLSTSLWCTDFNHQSQNMSSK